MKNMNIKTKYLKLATIISFGFVLVMPLNALADSSGWDYTPVAGDWDYTPVSGDWDYTPVSGSWDYTPVSGISSGASYYGGSYSSYYGGGYGSYASNYSVGSGANIVSGSYVGAAPQSNYQASYSVGSGIGISGGSSNSQGNYWSVNGNCSGAITNNSNGSLVTWTANGIGGNGNYNYSWSGDEGLSGSGQYIQKTYYMGGIKNATVTITSDNNTVMRSCSIQIGNPQNQVLSYTDTPTLSSVYLSDLPATGAGNIIKVSIFLGSIILLSIMIALYFSKKSTKEQMLPVLGNIENKNQIDNNTLFSLQNNSIQNIENIARERKIILSSEAAIKIVKLCELEGRSERNIIESISDGKEWIAIGEKEIK